MDKKMKYTVFIVFATLVSCNQIKQQFSDGESEENNSVEKISETPMEPLETAFEQEHKVKEYLIADFNTDGKKDTLFLSANAEIDDQRRIVWNDAQSWKVYININGEAKNIYAEDIQLGKLELYYDRENNLIYLVENAPSKKEIQGCSKK